MSVYQEERTRTGPGRTCCRQIRSDGQAMLWLFKRETVSKLSSTSGSPQNSQGTTCDGPQLCWTEPRWWRWRRPHCGQSSQPEQSPPTLLSPQRSWLQTHTQTHRLQVECNEITSGMPIISVTSGNNYPGDISLCVRINGRLSSCWTRLFSPINL